MTEIEIDEEWEQRDRQTRMSKDQGTNSLKIHVGGDR